MKGGVLIQQPYELNSTLTADNPFIPEDIIQYGYDLIGTDRVNNIAKIGPGYWNDLPAMFAGSSDSKVPLNLTSGAMSGDYVCVLTVLPAWITKLGNNLGIAQILVNKNYTAITASFSNYPVTAGDTITITGLETIANTVTLDIILI